MVGPPGLAEGQPGGMLHDPAILGRAARGKYPKLLVLAISAAPELLRRRFPAGRR